MLTISCVWKTNSVAYHENNGLHEFWRFPADGWNFLLRWRRFEKGQLFFNVECGTGNYQRLEWHLRFRRPGTQPSKSSTTLNQMATKHNVTNIRTTVLLHKLRLLQPSYTIHAECSVNRVHSIWMCIIHKHSHVNYSSCNAVKFLQPNVKLDIKKTATFEACSWKNTKNISYKRKLLEF